MAENNKVHENKVSDPAHLLVVEDDEASRNMLKRRLKRRNYIVDAAAGGQEALELLEKQHFDVMLLDLMMPDVSGSDVITYTRNHYPHGSLPIIVVSARTDHTDIINALELGANDYVTKPIDFSLLEARLKKQLELHRNEKDYEDLVINLDRLIKQRMASLEGSGTTALAGMTEDKGGFTEIETNGMDSFLKYVPAVIYMSTAGPDRIFSFISEYFRILTGYEPNEMLENREFWKDIIHPDDREKVIKSLSELKEDEKNILRYRILLSNGDYRTIRDTFLVHSNSGQAVMAGIWTDVTE